MILGDTCTRRCGFCNVKTGKPTHNDPLEPLRVAQSVKRKMGLRHAVITSVDRDDLPDLGSSRLRRRDPLDPALRAGLQGRGADARLPRRGDAAGARDRRAARRVQPQRRDRAAALPARPPRLALPALLPRAAQRQGDGRRRGGHQVRADDRARRDEGGAARGVRRAARARRAGAHRRPVPAPHARPPAGGALLAPRRVRRARARGLRAGLRVGGRRPAGALELPRRADARAGRRGHDAARPRAASPPRSPRSPSRCCCCRATAAPAATAGRRSPAAARAHRGGGRADRAASSTWSAASSAERRDHRRPSSATTSAATAGRAWPSMPVALNHPDRRGLPRAAVRARRLRGQPGCPSPPARCCATTPSATAGAGCAPSPTPRAAHAAGGDRRTASTRPAARTTAGSLRSLEIYDFDRDRWRRGPSFPGPARNHTTGVAAGGRFYVLAGRDARELHGGRALRPAPAQLGAAAAAAHRARRDRRRRG